jgi:hypothetical protein
MKLLRTDVFLLRTGVIEAAPVGCVPAPDGWQLLRTDVFLLRTGVIEAAPVGFVPAPDGWQLLRTDLFLFRMVGSCSGWCY